MVSPRIIVNRSFSYDQYFDLVKEQSEKNLTSGEQTIEHIEATKLNYHRMKRLNKQVEINDKLNQLVKKIDINQTWLILAETWCGDGAQTIPVISKIASLNPKIDMKIIFRDENPDLMNKYLTNGTRSVPKLICSENESGKVIGTWGPRPEGIKQKAEKFKFENPRFATDEFKKQLHL